MVIKLSVPPPCIVILLAEPTTIFELPESNSKLLLVICVEVILNPPTFPPVIKLLNL